MSFHLIHRLNRYQDHIMEAQSQLLTDQLRLFREEVQELQGRTDQQLRALMNAKAPELLRFLDELAKLEDLEDQIQDRAFCCEVACNAELVTTHQVIEFDKIEYREVAREAGHR